MTLSDGYYSYADINRSTQAALVNTGAYLIDSTGNNVFYIQIEEKSTYYACQAEFSPTSISYVAQPQCILQYAEPAQFAQPLRRPQYTEPSQPTEPSRLT